MDPGADQGFGSDGSGVSAMDALGTDNSTAPDMGLIGGNLANSLERAWAEAAGKTGAYGAPVDPTQSGGWSFSDVLGKLGSLVPSALGVPAGIASIWGMPLEALLSGKRAEETTLGKGLMTAGNWISDITGTPHRGVQDPTTGTMGLGDSGSIYQALMDRLGGSTGTGSGIPASQSGDPQTSDAQQTMILKRPLSAWGGDTPTATTQTAPRTASSRLNVTPFGGSSAQNGLSNYPMPTQTDHSNDAVRLSGPTISSVLQKRRGETSNMLADASLTGSLTDVGRNAARANIASQFKNNAEQLGQYRAGTDTGSLPTGDFQPDEWMSGTQKNPGYLQAAYKAQGAQNTHSPITNAMLSRRQGAF